MKRNNAAIFLGGINALFALFFFAQLIISVRPASDDLQFILTRSSLGFLETLKYHYFNFSGRISNYFIFNLLSEFNLFSGFTVITYYTLIFAGLIYGAYRLLQKKLSMDKLPVFFMAILILELFYFISPLSAESWFWMCASTCYLLPCVTFILAIALQTQIPQKTISKFAGCLLLLYSGNSSENLSLAFIVLYFAYLRMKAYNPKSLKQTLFDPGLISLLLGFAVSIFSVGNIRRFNLEHSYSTTLSGNFFNGIISYVLQPDFFIGLLLLTVVLLALNRHFPPRSIHIKYLVLVILILLLVSLAPLYFIFNANYPVRTLIPLIAPFLFIVFLITRMISGRIQIEHELYMISAYTISIIALTILIISNTPRLKMYRASYDKRMETIEAHRKQGATSTLYLPALPDPGRVTGILELSADTTNEINQLWKKALNLPFNIAVENQADHKN